MPEPDNSAKAPAPRDPTAVSAVELRFAVDVAAGRQLADVVLLNARVLNVFTGAIEAAHVVLAGRLIAAVVPAGASSSAAAAAVDNIVAANVAAGNVVDLAGAFLAPGLIDGHVHIESSLVSPAAYAEGVLPRGVTGVVCDPHEIANVAGVAGVRWLLERSADLPFDVWVTVPSSVPSTPHETAGAELALADIEALLADPRVVGVAELMSYQAIVSGDEVELAKVVAAGAARKSPEGHAPGLMGSELQAYLASGISSDHESTSLAEGLEKLRSGVFLMVREGSVTRDLDALMPLVRPVHADRIGFVTDDRLPHDLVDEGGVDLHVRRAIAAGVDPVYAVRCGSYNTARHFGLRRRGAIAPGYFADLVEIVELEGFRADRVFKDGTLVAKDGELQVELPRSAAAAELEAAVHDTVRLPRLDLERLRLVGGGGPVRVIEVSSGQVLTTVGSVHPTVEGGAIVSDPSRDLLKLVCVERHGRNGGVGLGLVRGFGLARGALASSVGHDHHNIMAVGCDDADLVVACQRLQAIGGGFVVVAAGEVRAELRLEIAGLVTGEPLPLVRQGVERVEAAARALGASLPSPFMALSFLGLAVIPELRLTDHGLVNVGAGQIVPLDFEGMA